MSSVLTLNHNKLTNSRTLFINSTINKITIQLTTLNIYSSFSHRRESSNKNNKESVP